MLVDVGNGFPEVLEMMECGYFRLFELVVWLFIVFYRPFSVIIWPFLAISTSFVTTQHPYGHE